MARLRPNAVVYDLAYPYDVSWTAFQTVRAAVPACRWVVTTTDTRALTELVGPAGALPIIGKPFELETITAAVHTALRGPPAGDSSPMQHAAAADLHGTRTKGASAW